MPGSQPHPCMPRIHAVSQSLPRPVPTRCATERALPSLPGQNFSSTGAHPLSIGPPPPPTHPELGRLGLPQTPAGGGWPRHWPRWPPASHRHRLGRSSARHRCRHRCHCCRLGWGRLPAWHGRCRRRASYESPPPAAARQWQGSSQCVNGRVDAAHGSAGQQHLTRLVGRFACVASHNGAHCIAACCGF
jgi:hypothetical protein